ncbi:MAG TPA: HAMP domain-containing sensor histidine kinase [Bacteroidales bacterium]|nr:HAMP domain-containing sensor histidine kinase [Bacteroidales bacterium]
MNIYKKKKTWKLILFVAAVAIGGVSLLYTNLLMEKLSVEERKKVELWAEATKNLANGDPDQDVSFLFEVLKNNNTIPVILTDENDVIIAFRNIDSLKMADTVYAKRVLISMKNHHEPIVIELFEGHYNKIYYKDSTLLTQLQYYPFVQLGIIFLFIIVSYLAFSASRKAEQNHVWLGMSKETAHQLGTPISSLMGWVEIMKEQEQDREMISEMSKDIERLEKITARFSKIGSDPVLKLMNLNDVIHSAVTYIKTRASEKIRISVVHSNDEPIIVPLNQELFEWVIENLCKNAIDAMDGKGEIQILISDTAKLVTIDVKDNGKGIPKSKYKTIFQPGYSTKTRGWGLGLSLSKRIIVQYHKGKIFLKSSEINQGSTFRIILSKGVGIEVRSNKK